MLIMIVIVDDDTLRGGCAADDIYKTYITVPETWAHW
jgi:hypothetical protein